MRFTVGETDYEIDTNTLTIGELAAIEAEGIDPAPLIDGVPRAQAWRYTGVLIWLVRRRAGESMTLAEAGEVNALTVTFHPPASRRPPAKATKRARQKATA